MAISSGPYPYPYLHLHTTVEVPARQRDITRLYLLYVEDKAGLAPAQTVPGRRIPGHWPYPGPEWSWPRPN